MSKLEIESFIYDAEPHRITAVLRHELGHKNIVLIGDEVPDELEKICASLVKPLQKAVKAQLGGAHTVTAVERAKPQPAKPKARSRRHT